MSWVQEIIDLFGKFSFFEIVEEFEQGLYFRNGIVREKPIKYQDKELEQIVAEEKKAISDSGGRVKYLIPFRKVVMPEGYKRDFLGFPKHPKRYRKDKVLNPGFYFHIPIIDYIVTESKQEDVLDLGFINVLSADPVPKNIAVSVNIHYQVMDLYKAYTEVRDYERSLGKHTLSVLADCCQGKTLEEWRDPKIKAEISKQVVSDLRKLVTEDWGLKVHRVYISDIGISQVYRVITDNNGPAPTAVMVSKTE